ncbi:hypothetical protein VPH35_121386 [Triticum aestivum]
MEIKPEVILVACLSFGISNRGSAAGCRTSDLVVTSHTYPDPGGRPVQYKKLVNNCDCTQKNVKLACPRFNSSIEVYPDTAIKPDGDGILCSLYAGRPVGPKEKVFFDIHSSTEFSFQPVSSTIICYKSPSLLKRATIKHTLEAANSHPILSCLRDLYKVQ